jgi:prenyltransferase beta subunit
MPHLAPTYAAINSLLIIGTEEAYCSIDRAALHAFLRRRKHADGYYTMHDDGEIDVRSARSAATRARRHALCSLTREPRTRRRLGTLGCAGARTPPWRSGR